MQDAYKVMDEADNVVIAAPIYFGNLTGSLLNWASRLQYFWVSRYTRYIRKVEPISTKYRKGAVILVNGGETGHIDPAIFVARDLLKKVRAECCEILNWAHADGENQPLPTNKDIEKIVELADTLNNR